MNLEHRWEWTGSSGDPNDEEFGDIVEQTTLSAVDSYDAVLVGEPYDGGVVGRAGAREGPKAIREALATTKTHHFDAGPVESIADLGTVDIPGGESVSTVQEAVRTVAASVHETDAVPVFLGGDGSLTYANVAPLLQSSMTDGGYVTDGGFGDDEETVGDVEHFDPTGGSADEEEDDTSDDESEADGDDTESDEQAHTDEQAETEKEETTDGDDQEGESEGSESDDADESETEDQSEKESESTDEESGEKTEKSDVGTTETVDAGEGSEVEASVSDSSASDESTPDESSVGVVSLDAHLDYAHVDGQPTSGTAYRQLLDDGLDALAVLGARHFETTTAHATKLRDAGGEIITAEEIAEDTVDGAEQALDAMADVESVYVSVDMDVLDATAAPGVSTPTPGGITSRELFRLLRLLASEDRLAGVEIVETAPPLCPDGRTARTAARAVAHALSVAGEA